MTTPTGQDADRGPDSGTDPDVSTGASAGRGGAAPDGAVPPGAAVTVREVGTRDGLQIEREFVPTADKIAVLRALIGAGLRHLQVTSFVSPRAVPQLADAEEVVAGVAGIEGLHLCALVPNARGAERAAATGVHAIEAVLSASETHNLKNLNRPVARSLEDAAEVAAVARGAGRAFEAGIATAFGCPFEGEVAPARVGEIAGRMAALGATHIGLGDTTGMAVPPTVRAAVRAVRETAPGVAVGLHFHNTRGVGLACVMAGLAEGVAYYDASVGGLGGCPFAPGATGNVCTEDLVYLLEESGHDTGVDLARLVEAARLMEGLIGRTLPGQVMKAGPRLRRYDAGAVATASG